MTLRRIPGASANGGSLFISTSDSSGVASRMGDSIESRRVDGASVFLAVIAPMIEENNLSAAEARHMLGLAAGHLRDIVNVAESRGERLGIGIGQEDDEDEDTPEEDAG
ncbi:hypothetical protein [Streptomyces sp. NPDC006285]|uniref:hypothetical protein n=1 Tax=Streptomyces sp. NPDC006285 TaxID=3364742 RepID=UPI003685F04F